MGGCIVYWYISLTSQVRYDLKDRGFVVCTKPTKPLFWLLFSYVCMIEGSKAPKCDWFSRMDF